MLDRFATPLGRLEQDAQVPLDGILAHVVGQPVRAQRAVELLLLRALLARPHQVVHRPRLPSERSAVASAASGVGSAFQSTAEAPVRASAGVNPRPRSASSTWAAR